MSTDDSGTICRVDPRLVELLCRQATSTASDAAGTGGAVYTVTSDPLDHSVWIRLADIAAADIATTALTGYGLAVTAGDSDTIHVTGWDARLLRRRLGILLAGIDDLSSEWEATAELATYFYDRYSPTGREVDLSDVLAAVEESLRTATPLPRQAPSVDDVASLLELIDAARDSYLQLIEEHLSLAETTLTGYLDALKNTQQAKARDDALSSARDYQSQRQLHP